MDTSAQTFDQDVIQKSHQVPVVVDFWAPWCGPCRVLGPVLEKLEQEAAGAWILAKLNVDEHPTLAQEYHIMGIPAVKLFKDGRVVGEFSGALPEPQLRAWFEQYLPSEAAQAYEAGLEARRSGDTAAAQKHLERVLELEPGHKRARLHLAELVMRNNRARAATLLEGLDQDIELGEDVQMLLHLARLDERLNDGGEGEAWDRYRDGIRAFLSGNNAEALEAWIDVLKRDRKLDDDGARQNCIALFHVLGEEHPITREYRPKFASALF